MIADIIVIRINELINHFHGMSGLSVVGLLLDLKIWKNVFTMELYGLLKSVRISRTLRFIVKESVREKKAVFGTGW